MLADGRLVAAAFVVEGPADVAAALVARVLALLTERDGVPPQAATTPGRRPIPNSVAVRRKNARLATTTPVVQLEENSMSAPSFLSPHPINPRH
jgi:hypothetical protein